MLIARVIVSVLLALLLLATGGGKLLGLQASLAIRDGLRINARTWKAIGVLELLGVVGLVVGIWFPATGLAASIGVVLLMIGAIAARARVQQRNAGLYAGDAVLMLVAAAAVVLHVLAL